MEKLIKLMLTEKGKLYIPSDEVEFSNEIHTAKIVKIIPMIFNGKKSIESQLGEFAIRQTEDPLFKKIPENANAYLASEEKDYLKLSYHETKHNVVHAICFYDVSFTKEPRKLGERMH